MPQLHEDLVYDLNYGNKSATVYLLNKGVKIIGFKYGNHFDLRVLSIGNNPRRCGLGVRALRFLRPKFRRITVSEIDEKALLFWVKMQKRGLVDDLRSIKDGKKIRFLNRTTKSIEPYRYFGEGLEYQCIDAFDVDYGLS